MGSPSNLDGNLNTLFKSGDNGYACFRIPAIVVTEKGTILAFAEARKNGCSDTGNIDLVMKRSEDNGMIWSDLNVIWDDGQNVCGNPAPVVDKITGEIHLLSTWNNGKDHESQIIDETSIDSREIYYMKSKDDGQSWSTPKNITASVKLPNWTWYATGPVHGIQLERGDAKGRLVIPCDHIEAKTKRYYSHVIFSDDHGKTWELGGTTPNDQVNECTVVELTNGDLMLNMRNYERKDHQVRQVAISKDSGATWENQRFEKDLPEPRCQASSITVSNSGKDILLFTNPADGKERVNMTLSISRNQGRSWDEKHLIYGGPSAYSDLVELKNGRVMILFEAGKESPYEGIHYKTITVPHE